MIGSEPAEGIVTIVEGDPAAASCDASSGVEATLLVAFDGDVDAREDAPFNDDMLVMAMSWAILVSVLGHPGDERIASQNIDRKSKIFSFLIAKEQSNCVR
jgi:hypothetical protein